MTTAISYNIETIRDIIQGHWLLQTNNRTLSYVSLDSRKIADPAATLFFAFRTKHRDARIFIPVLYQSGVRNFVVEQEPADIGAFPEANILLVKNPLEAFQLLAVFHRKQFPDLPVLGITGSNGKTIVKEWLHHLLEKEYIIVRSPNSFNSQIGVPLSVLQIRDYHTLGIFEAGISRPGEMQHLEEMIRPEIGIFTNIGNAHDEGFESRQQKIREKLLLFQNVKTLIFCADAKDLSAEIRSFPFHQDDIQFFTWGREAGNRLQIISIQQQQGASEINAVFNANEISVSLPFTDDASVENAIHCWCVLLVMNRAGAAVLKRFQTLFPIAMRMEMLPGIHHSKLINDSYSNDLYSLRLALDFLAQQSRKDQRTLILSDLVESGHQPNILYPEIAALMRRSHISRFVGIGPELCKYQEFFSFVPQRKFYLNTGDLLGSFESLDFTNQTILIKGARQFGLDRITRLLSRQSHQTVLSINLTSLAHNVKVYRQKLSSETKVMAMVKAFGYGTGAFEIASTLEFNQVNYLAVAYADEGISLRNAGSSLPIMVMNAAPDQFEELINYGLEPEIYSLSMLRSLIDFLHHSGKMEYAVHIMMDTGMHRLGLMPEDLEECLTCLQQHPEVKVASIFSHLSASDDQEADNFTRGQFALFQQIIQRFKKALGYPFLTHIANTAAISRFPEMELDMVRLGIGMYGIDSQPEMQQYLETVATLTTTISQIRRVNAGDSVGYGRSAILKEDKTIATVGIGYADGYSRQFGFGKGRMLVQGKLAAVAGNVCMDMTMLDITEIENAREGDEVIVFGKDLSIRSLAARIQTIPYELLTGISQRVKRVYFEE